MVCSRPPSVKSSVLPTAQTSLAETAVTPVRKLFPFVVGNGFGLGTTNHVVPFQCSVSVRSIVAPSRNPTAHASVLESAEAAFNSLFKVPLLGLWRARHVVPSKCSISVLKALDDGPRNVPTAH